MREAVWDQLDETLAPEHGSFRSAGGAGSGRTGDLDRNHRDRDAELRWVPWLAVDYLALIAWFVFMKKIFFFVGMITAGEGSDGTLLGIGRASVIAIVTVIENVSATVTWIKTVSIGEPIKDASSDMNALMTE